MAAGTMNDLDRLEAQVADFRREMLEGDLPRRVAQLEAAVYGRDLSRYMPGGDRDGRDPFHPNGDFPGVDEYG